MLKFILPAISLGTTSGPFGAALGVGNAVRDVVAPTTGKTTSPSHSAPGDVNLLKVEVHFGSDR